MRAAATGIEVVGTCDFDASRLREFLSDRFGPSPLRVERISGGQSNPTYVLTHGHRKMVLRKQPAGALLKGAHAIDREYRVMSALVPTDVPVPAPILFQDGSDVLGTPFYLMDFLEGRVFSDCALPGMAPDERRAIFLAMAETLARLHAIRPDDVGLGDYGRHHGYFDRQVKRWSRQLAQSSGERIPELDELCHWIVAKLPADDGAVAIAHGDFRLGNLMYHPTEPRVIAILDWELSTIGHPLADLGFCCMPWHTAPDEYGGLLGLDIAALGLPDEAEFVARYQKELRSDRPLEPFHLAFALFRFAVIFVGIADRAAAGNAASEDAADLAPLARRFALRALEIIEGRVHTLRV